MAEQATSLVRLHTLTLPKFETHTVRRPHLTCLLPPEASQNLGSVRDRLFGARAGSAREIPRSSESVQRAMIEISLCSHLRGEGFRAGHRTRFHGSIQRQGYHTRGGMDGKACGASHSIPCWGGTSANTEDSSPSRFQPAKRPYAKCSWILP